MARLALTVVFLLLAGCGSMGGMLGGDSDAQGAADQSESTAPAPGLNAQGLAVYLETMRLLVEGDPVTQAETFGNVEQAADLAPTTTNRLQLALAYATPGHPSSDPLQAQRQLSELLAARDTLLPEEQILATIHLKDVEQRLILAAETERLQQDSSEQLSRQSADSARQLEAMQAENQRLRAELDDALEKLEAITSIEQSIRERANGTDTP